jgi:predicted ester cyclase
VSEANKAALRRIYDDVFSQGRLEVVDEVVAADAVDHSPPPNATGSTRADLKGFAALVRQGFPDVRFTPVLELADGDKVVAIYEMVGTHQGEFLGLPPSGEQVTVRGVDIVTVVDGKCTEHWGWDDSWQLMVAGGPSPA